MAKILFGAGVGDARGSIGSATFTKGRNGAVLRMKVSPVQPRSPAVMAVRANFMDLSKRWGFTLSDAQRAAWMALAAITSYTNQFGNTYHPTGLQLYQGCNRNLQLCGLVPIDAAPGNLDVDVPLTLTVAAILATQELNATFTPTPIPAAHYMAFDAVAGHNPGRNFHGAGYRFVGAFAPALASPRELAAAYIAKFGALRSGTKVTIRGWLINTANGSASQELVASDTVN